MFRSYKPKFWKISVDFIIISINAIIVFAFFPLTTKNPFSKYSLPLLLFLLSWFIVSYFVGRYRSNKNNDFSKSFVNLSLTCVITFLLFGGFILIQPHSPYSQNVLMVTIGGVFFFEYVFLFFYFAYKYATRYDEVNVNYDARVFPEFTFSLPLNEQEAEERKEKIISYTNEKIYEFLKKSISLNDRSSYFLFDIDKAKLNEIPAFQYSTFVQLKELNNLRGINGIFARINERLPENGTFVCCYKTLNTEKKIIYREYPKIIAKIVYSHHFMVHRVLPKLLPTGQLYLDITGGVKRTFSKTEILGRLSFAGFDIEKQAKVGDLNFVIAKRARNIQSFHTRIYGPFIKLKRVGRGGKLINVYKIRTMHPYAEYLQSYVYEKYNLAEGGKFNRDIRVTSWGRFLRKYWLDELPMIWNLLKGDLKLVGVRPISRQYFRLYSKELQEERIKHKPGLLPPFYADRPKTLDEIQESEMKYLMECDQKGTLRTDIKYFFLILKNILFKQSRSA